MDNFSRIDDIPNPSGQFPTPEDTLMKFGITKKLLYDSKARLISRNETSDRSFAKFALPTGLVIVINYRFSDEDGRGRRIILELNLDFPNGRLWIKKDFDVNCNLVLTQVSIEPKKAQLGSKILRLIHRNNRSILRVNVNSGDSKSVSHEFIVIKGEKYRDKDLVATEEKTGFQIALDSLSHELICALISRSLDTDLSSWLIPDPEQVRMLKLEDFEIPVKASKES